LTDIQKLVINNNLSLKFCSTSIKAWHFFSSLFNESWIHALLFMSTIRMKNNLGSRMVPWCTLVITWNVDEPTAFAVMDWVLSLSYRSMSPLFHQYQAISIKSIGSHDRLYQILLQSQYIWHQHSSSSSKFKIESYFSYSLVRQVFLCGNGNVFWGQHGSISLNYSPIIRTHLSCC